MEPHSDSELDEEEELNSPSSPIFDIQVRRKRGLDLENDSLSRTSNEPTNDADSPLSMGRRRRRKGTLDGLEETVTNPVEEPGWKMSISAPVISPERPTESPKPYKMKLVDISDVDSPMSPMRLTGRERQQKDRRDMKEVLRREDLLGSFLGDDIIRKTAGFRPVEERRQPKYPRHGYYLKDSFYEPQPRPYSSEFQRILNEFSVWGQNHASKRKQAPEFIMSLSSRMEPKISQVQSRSKDTESVAPYKSKRRKNSTVLIEYMAKKRKQSSTHFTESLELKRKSTSVDYGAFLRGRTELKGQFTVLERHWKGDDIECLVVVLKDCTTLHLKVQHPKMLSSDGPRILEATPKIFTKDHAFYDIFNLTVRFVLNHYECIEVGRFLCLLYIIYFDNHHFYKACKSSFGDRYSVSVDTLKESMCVARGTKEDRGEVQVHLFTNSIRIRHHNETQGSAGESVRPRQVLEEGDLAERKEEELANKKRSKKERRKAFEGLFNKRFIELLASIVDYNLTKPI